jgi:hypothetical protein
MNNIGLYLTINKFTTYFETNTFTSIHQTLEEAKERIITTLSSEFNKLNIDFPSEIDEFEHIWFKQQYVKANCFDYRIWNNLWTRPWDDYEIYAEVLEKMHQQEIANPPDFSELYGEPNPDENKIDKFRMEISDEMVDFENKLKDIIEQSKNTDVFDDSIKKCECDKCTENDTKDINV